jgi:hypothetical protein
MRPGGRPGREAFFGEPPVPGASLKLANHMRTHKQATIVSNLLTCARGNDRSWSGSGALGPRAHREDQSAMGDTRQQLAVFPELVPLRVTQPGAGVPATCPGAAGR